MGEGLKRKGKAEGDEGREEKWEERFEEMTKKVLLNKTKTIKGRKPAGVFDNVACQQKKI
jgi:hypothetical protein